eukprot:TRINITY_DN6337_c1_g4_i1.p1 TRINITY_DN6337_c1_g4~~TRINITY_DN6337_c1_g4_i1.p1  ORF type:complete len:667 (+),score=107.82 TRINITY_DN6337_c1_g4_i1:8-2008(+)
MSQRPISATYGARTVPPALPRRPGTATRLPSSPWHRQQQLVQKHTAQMQWLEEQLHRRETDESPKAPSPSAPAKGELRLSRRIHAGGSPMPAYALAGRPVACRPRSACGTQMQQHWTFQPGSAAAVSPQPPARPRSAGPGGALSSRRPASAGRPSSACVAGATARYAQQLAARRAAAGGPAAKAACGAAMPRRFPGLVEDAIAGGIPPPCVARGRRTAQFSLLRAFPDELLGRVCRACGAGDIIALLLTCASLAAAMPRVAEAMLSYVYAVERRCTGHLAAGDGEQSALSPLRQLHALERMVALRSPTMAFFKGPIVLDSNARNGPGSPGSCATKLLTCHGSLLGATKIRVCSMACGPGHLMLLDQRGRAWALGDPRAGGVSITRTEELLQPAPVVALAGIRLVKAACGKGHTVAMAENGNVYTWGRSLEPRPSASASPVEAEWCLPDPDKGVAGEAVDVAAGDDHAGAISLTGDTYTWGLNLHGQCGQEPTSAVCFLAPQRCGGRLGTTVARRMACGRYHSVVLSSDGKVFTFGAAMSGQLGRTCGWPASPPWQPGQTDLDTAHGGEGPAIVVQVACGDEHTLCLTDHGRLLAFGSGDHGQLGLGGVRSYRIPVLVRTLGLAREIAAGGTWSLVRGRCGGVHLAGRGEEDPDTDFRLLRQIIDSK